MIKLSDLLSVMDASCTIFVWAYSIEDPESSVLVGIKSESEDIDPKYNDCNVDYISVPTEGAIDVNIDCEVTSDEVIELYE